MDPARRALRDVGRVARLDLVFERRAGRTVVAHQFAEAPLRIGSTRACDDVASAIVVCTGPGIFAGDSFQHCVHVKRGARVVLASQSALQAHPSSAPLPAQIAHWYRVDEDAELHCQWDPLIPFAGARIEQRYTVDVAAGGRLFWSDALTAGRTSRGEAWAFDRLAHELRLRVDRRLTYVERFTLEPRETPHATPPTPHPTLRDARYFSTVLVLDRGVTAGHASALHDTLDEEAGVDVIDDGALLVRLTSADGVRFSTARRAVRRFALTSLFKLPALVDRR